MIWTIIPIRGSKAQGIDSIKTKTYEEVNQERDSIRQQALLSLDLLEYQLGKDTLHEPTKK